MLLAFALVVVKPEVPHHDLRIRAAGRIECQLEAARRQEVVGVQEHEVASPRQGDRAVASARAARVFLLDDAHLAGKASLVLAQDRDRIIGRPIVDADNLPRRFRLSDDAVEAFG